MGERSLYWFLPVTNSVGDGLAFPVSEDVRGILRGMRGNLGRMEVGGSVVDDDDEEEEEGRVYRRDGEGRWLMHD